MGMSNAELHIIETAERMGYYPRREHVEEINLLSVEKHQAKWGHVYTLKKGSKESRELRRQANADIEASIVDAIRDVMERAKAVQPLATVKGATKKRAATAYHEAGHAVIAWHLGVRFRHVTIKPDDDSLGHVLLRAADKRVRPDINLTPSTRDFLERRIVCALAGPEAERRVTGRYNNVGASRDHQLAGNYADYIVQDYEAEEELSAFINWLQLRARRMNSFDPHWHLITMLGNRLQRVETISGADTVKILNDEHQTFMRTWRPEVS